MTESEKLLSAFSQLYFFEEFVQDNLQFIDHVGNTQELADLLLNLGDVVVAIQIKERSDSVRTNDIAAEMKWFKKKMGIAKQQINNTVEFIREGKNLEFQNKRGIKIPIPSDVEIIPLVVFLNESIKDYPHLLEKHTADGISVNCMSIADFQAMCRELVSPAEIIDYLKFRRDFYEKNGPVDMLICEASETDMMILCPSSNEALVRQFLVERYGVKEIKRDDNQFDLFREFVQQTAIRSTAGRDDYATYNLLLFLSHFRRLEILAFRERLFLAVEKSKHRDYGIHGSLRNEDNYAVFFVSSPPETVYSMDFLLELAQQKCDPKKLLQVYVWWEDDKNFRIDYLLWDRTETE